MLFHSPKDLVSPVHIVLFFNVLGKEKRKKQKPQLLKYLIKFAVVISQRWGWVLFSYCDIARGGIIPISVIFTLKLHHFCFLEVRFLALFLTHFLESSLHQFAFFLVYFLRLHISSELHFSYIPQVVVSSLYHPILPAPKPPPWVFWNFPLGFLFKVRFCKKSCIVLKFLDAREFWFLVLLIISNPK